MHTLLHGRALALSLAVILGGCATTPTPSPISASTPSAANSAVRPASSTTTAPVASAARPNLPGAATPSAPTPPASAAGSPSVASAAAAAAAAASGGPPLRPFADVIRDAKRTDGLFPVYEKDERVWIELKPEHLGGLYYFQVNTSRAFTAGMLNSRRMWKSNIVTFRRIGNTVQFVARNFKNYAAPNTPTARAVEDNTSDSLLASVPVVSAAHPTRNSVLIDASSLLMSDIAMIGAMMDMSYRAGYSLDRGNSYFKEVNSRPDGTGFDVTMHFATPRPPMPNPAAPPGTPAPQAIEEQPDPRSAFVGVYYSFMKLPEAPMRPRHADNRIGHFNTRMYHFGDESQPSVRRYHVHRWRLEKKDPTAEVSEPKQAITYWLDKNIPLEYRDTIRAGVLEWNKAFEKAGFKNAIKVEQQADDAKFNTEDARYASIKWVVDYSDGALGVGPSAVDPRSGEILDADISISHGWTRLPRLRSREQYPLGASTHAAHAHTSDGLCDYADASSQELAFSMDLLQARDELRHDDPKINEIVLAWLKDVTMHEVGHTLGLRHNFRASTLYTEAQLADPAFTKVNGIAGSVMDYNAQNLALQGEQQGEYVMSTLGPYDYWAIDYAYREFKPGDEAEGLSKIAARSGEPLLVYATDEEISSDGDGMDPQVTQRDIGRDPLIFAERRLKLSRELFDRLQARTLAPGESYERLRVNFDSGFLQIPNALQIAARHVGGVVFRRDHAGTSQSPYTPVAAGTQRQALRLINQHAFAIDGLGLSPEFVSRLVEPHLDRGNRPPSDIAVGDRWLSVQRSLLDRLLSDSVARRISESIYKLKDTKDILGLGELYESMQQSIWSEVKAGVEVSQGRRALQREHARRVAVALTRAATGSSDARALHRLNAQTLLAELKAMPNLASLSRESRAHVLEMQNLFEEALKAPMLRDRG